MRAACFWQSKNHEGLTGRRYHLGDNKEVFDAEAFVALRIIEEQGQSGQRYTVFSDCQPAIQRTLSDQLGPDQQWARAIFEVTSRLVAAGNEIDIRWVPANRGVRGNEVADGMAKEAAENRAHSVPDEVRWQTSLQHLTRRATERRTTATSQ